MINLQKIKFGELVLNYQTDVEKMWRSGIRFCQICGLLLDEPTAHLDPLIEVAGMRDSQQLMASRTTLLITHQLIGLETMDKILVLQTGRIVERGQHYKLMQVGGFYHHFVGLQQ